MELSQQTRHSSTASTISTIPEETGAVEPEDFPQIYNDQIDNEPDIYCSRTIASTSHQREPSETAYFLSHGDTGSSPKEKRGHAAETQTVQGQIGKSTWRPLTLRPPYLSFLFILSLFLGILILILTVVSSRNYGLGNDDGSSILLFGWRFSPTLVATIYGLLVASLLNDVRRTEIFARLSGPDGASAKNTLCFPSRAWWNDPVDALNKGTRSWTLFFTSTLYILALVASPLSAGLFSPTDTQIPREVMFHKANIEGLTWPQDTEDSIMFRTISGAVLNQYRGERGQRYLTTTIPLP